MFAVKLIPVVTLDQPSLTILLILLILAPRVYPQNFGIVNVTTDTVTATWQPIDFEETDGILLGYRIYYRLADVKGTWSNVSVTNLTGSVPVLSLRSYEIRVCGYTRVGNGILSPIQVVNTTGFSKYIVFLSVHDRQNYHHLPSLSSSTSSSLPSSLSSSTPVIRCPRLVEH